MFVCFSGIDTEKDYKYGYNDYSSGETTQCDWQKETVKVVTIEGYRQVPDGCCQLLSVLSVPSVSCYRLSAAVRRQLMSAGISC